MHFPSLLGAAVYSSWGLAMRAMIQKKITIKREHEVFLAACRKYGFADQSSVVRAALDDFIKETKRKQRRAQIARKAKELSTLYTQNTDLTAFTAIDGDDFYEASKHMGNKPESDNWSRDTENTSGSNHQ